MQNVKKLKFQKTGSRYGQTFGCSDNPGKKNWKKIEKSSKTGQGKKSLISIFACFLTVTDKVELVQGILGTRLFVHPNLRFS